VILLWEPQILHTLICHEYSLFELAYRTCNTHRWMYKHSMTKNIQGVVCVYVLAATAYGWQVSCSKLRVWAGGELWNGYMLWFIECADDQYLNPIASRFLTSQISSSSSSSSSSFHSLSYDRPIASSKFSTECNLVLPSFSFVYPRISLKSSTICLCLLSHLLSLLSILLSFLE
jgi:hypothetical protein